MCYNPPPVPTIKGYTVKGEREAFLIVVAKIGDTPSDLL
jgi:hypothetical protein